MIRRMGSLPLRYLGTIGRLRRSHGESPLFSRGACIDYFSACFAWGCAIAVSAAFGWLLFDLAYSGLSHIGWSFLVETPIDVGRAGGIGPMILSTLMILVVCTTISVPLSLGAALMLSEFTPIDSFFGRMVRRSLDVLAGVPSIVFGLFGNAFFCITLGMGYSIAAGGLTLACMVLPILTRVSEQAIRAVPMEYRHGAAALGMSQTTLTFRILLPSAAPALAAGMVLGLGRALAETAALIFTSGYVTRMPSSLSDSGRSLSVHIYDMAMNVTGGNERAYATAAVLVGLLLVINAVSVTLTSYAGRFVQADVSTDISS